MRRPTSNQCYRLAQVSAAAVRQRRAAPAHEGSDSFSMGTEEPRSARRGVEMDETSGDRDVVEVLTVDHREATALIEQILSTPAPEERRDLADTLISELVRHSVAEEMYVYPAIKEHLPNGEEAVRHDQE